MMCRDCWEPVELPEGQELCEWCAMTPAQSERRAWIDLLLFVLVLLVVFAMAVYGVTGEPT